MSVSVASKSRPHPGGRRRAVGWSAGVPLLVFSPLSRPCNIIAMPAKWEIAKWEIRKQEIAIYEITKWKTAKFEVAKWDIAQWEIAKLDNSELCVAAAVAARQMC